MMMDIVDDVFLVYILYAYPEKNLSNINIYAIYYFLLNT